MYSTITLCMLCLQSMSKFFLFYLTWYSICITSTCDLCLTSTCGLCLTSVCRLLPLSSLDLCLLFIFWRSGSQSQAFFCRPPLWTASSNLVRSICCAKVRPKTAFYHTFRTTPKHVAVPLTGVQQGLAKPSRAVTDVTKRHCTKLVQVCKTAKSYETYVTGRERVRKDPSGCLKLGRTSTSATWKTCKLANWVIF